MMNGLCMAAMLRTLLGWRRWCFAAEGSGTDADGNIIIGKRSDGDLKFAASG